MNKADIKFVTLKTVFLVALASAKRVSEIQALSGSIQHKEDWSLVRLSFAKDFLAKTELPSCPDQSSRTFVIPALSQIASERADCTLCPVRAIRIYLDRTKTRRPAGSRLFLPLSGSKSSVHKNTIALWIRTVIKRSYATDRSALQRLHGRLAHEVRALSTSWSFSHNLSLSEVMQAASWRTHSTFSDFYLRDVSLMSDGMYQLGPVVTAQKIVEPPSQSSRPKKRRGGRTSTEVSEPRPSSSQGELITRPCLSISLLSY